MHTNEMTAIGGQYMQREAKTGKLSSALTPLVKEIIAESIEEVKQGAGNPAESEYEGFIISRLVEEEAQS